MNNQNLLYTSKRFRTFFLTLVVVLAAQINLNFFIDNFKISIAVILLPAFLFLLDNFSLLPVTIFSAFGVYLSRILYYWTQSGQLEYVVRSFFPEIFFYLTFGLLLFAYDKLKKHQLKMYPFLTAVVFMDYLSNLVELLLRVNVQTFEFHTQLSIASVAVARTALLWVILSTFDSYRLTLLNKEHADRYQRLMVLISRLNGEVLWMEKNTSLIENTMNTSYQLYHKLQEAESGHDLAVDALTVAKDIHEIKKEYFLIMRGLSEALKEEASDDGMVLNDVFAILGNALRTEADALKLHPEFIFNCNNQLYTKEPYLLLSVFHNLFANALEASTSETPRIELSQTENANCYIFTVSDNGPGIDTTYIEQVFDPGFSTKIDFETGTINRGLGLNIVKDIIEEELKGKIYLESQPGNTVFTIYIPKERSEVKAS